jgi:hypothetical protein
MEITPAAQLPAPADRIEAAADYLLDRQERGELDGLTTAEITLTLDEAAWELEQAGYPQADIDAASASL